jgi:hypothetical protein
VLHEILRVFINLFDENVFQNPQIFRNTLRLFPEQSTLTSIAMENHVAPPSHGETRRYGPGIGVYVSVYGLL